jgi:hypothetical protein
MGNHPQLIQQAVELCSKIEAIPASAEQTAASVAASNLSSAIQWVEACSPAYALNGRYVAVNEYGDCFPETASLDMAECEQLANKKCGGPYENFGVSICQIGWLPIKGYMTTLKPEQIGHTPNWVPGYPVVSGEKS